MAAASSPHLELALSLRVLVGEATEVAGVDGMRRVVPIVGGSFASPADSAAGLAGAVLAGGSDVQRVRADGAIDLTARYALRAETGATLFFENSGLRHTLDDAPYFVGSGRFETAEPSLAWLTRAHFVTTGAKTPEHVQIDVWRVVRPVP